MRIWRVLRTAASIVTLLWDIYHYLRQLSDDPEAQRLALRVRKAISDL